MIGLLREEGVTTAASWKGKGQGEVQGWEPGGGKAGEATIWMDDGKDVYEQSVNDGECNGTGKGKVGHLSSLRCEAVQQLALARACSPTYHMVLKPPQHFHAPPHLLTRHP